MLVSSTQSSLVIIIAVSSKTELSFKGQRDFSFPISATFDPLYNVTCSLHRAFDIEFAAEEIQAMEVPLLAAMFLRRRFEEEFLRKRSVMVSPATRKISLYPVVRITSDQAAIKAQYGTPHAEHPAQIHLSVYFRLYCAIVDLKIGPRLCIIGPAPNKQRQRVQDTSTT